MGSLSNYAELELLDHLFGVGSYTPPTIYVGLSTADPTEDGSGLAEPSGNNYARKAHSSWDVAASRLTENTGVITLNQASGSWGTITHYALFDAATEGNMLAYGALETPKEVVSGNTPSIADGEIEVSFNAGAIFTFLANELLDHLFGNGVYTAPTIYVGLSTTTPADDGTNISEPSGNNYARVAHSSWDAAAGGATENTGAITFPTPSGSWGTITYGILMDAATAGNPLLYGTVENQTPDDGDIVRYNDGDLDITLT